MSEQTPESASAALSLPDAPSLDWLRKQAKRRLAELRATKPKAKLAEAQFALAKQYGFPSWRALKAHVDSLSLEGQLFEAAKKGDVKTLATLLDQHPDALNARAQPYEHTLLHAAAQSGQPATVEYLLRRGIGPNVKEKGDDTYPMHWAAAAGNLDVVRLLADAGGDVVGHGDDHHLEVIGWATCWEGCDDDAHRAVANFLVSRGASHHIYSAIAMRLEDEVRQIVARDPSALNTRMSRNEMHQTPLQFAIRMKRPEMVRLLIELGADPLATDGEGQYFPNYAESPDDDAAALEAVRRLALGELQSADRGRRQPRGSMMDVIALVGLRDYDNALRILSANPSLINSGVLHMMAKRRDVTAVNWLLERGADPNARWAHVDMRITPLHAAIWGGSTEAARLILDAGADPTIKDTRHDSDALGWAEFFGRVDIVPLLSSHRGPRNA
jgi:ankyrin repeat protein